ncbi:hypothetical protein SCHPADRAFT_119401 [Schizopora paradoxa]|uniref:Uncharacterized protein n=1 Tax=Schizopora paradoxa TaxID=27342 RepID=A0A0H2S3E1_9AGAM|nr:hypothetical protein SCHPADRAFT_119401 [Schizopora paradoxa]
MSREDFRNLNGFEDSSFRSCLARLRSSTIGVRIRRPNFAIDHPLTCSVLARSCSSSRALNYSLPSFYLLLLFALHFSISKISSL